MRFSFRLLMILSLMLVLGSLLNTTLAAAYQFFHLTTNDGLPHQQVEDLSFDADGYLWVATRNGLGRYDGYDMEVYQHDPSDSLSLSHNFVTHLLCDSKGRLWCATDAGICRYDARTDRFRRYDVSRQLSSLTEMSDGRIIATGDRLFVYDEDKDAFMVSDNGLSQFILSSAASPDGRLFLATNHGIYFYDSSLSKLTQLSPDIGSDFLTGADGIVPMKVDGRGRLWIGRNGKGVMNISLGSGISNVYGPSLLNTIVRSICEDSDGNVWLGTESGIAILKPDGSIERIRQDFNEASGLNDNAVYSIVRDSNDNIWVGTYFGGINALLRHGGMFRTVRPGDDALSLTGKAVRHIIEPRRNEIWIATEDGGLDIMEIPTGRIRRFSAIPELGDNIHSLYHDGRNGWVWIGTFRNGLFRYDLNSGQYRRYMPDDGSGLRSNAIFDFTRLADGSLWVATTLGLYRYDSPTDTFLPSGLPPLDDEFIYGLKSDPEGRYLWVATRNKGVFMLDSKTMEVTNWNSHTPGTLLTDDYIPSLLVDSKGDTWVGTNNNGVFRIDCNDRSISPVSIDPALTTACVCGMVEDSRGIIWISTSQGLLRYDPQSDAFSRFTSYNGLPTNQFNFQSGIQASDSLMYVGTVNGLVKFDPRSLYAPSRPYAVHMQALRIGGGVMKPFGPDSPLSASIDHTDTLMLDHAQAQSFIIEYGVVNPGSIGDIQYQVKLEGIDKDWRNVGSSRQFVGMRLPAGTYRLFIRASDSEYNWDNAPVKSMVIKVRPPWYATWWACILYVLAFAAMLWLAWMYVRRRQTAKERRQMLQMEKEQELKLNQAKIEFFTEISHELKTPLSLISAPLKRLSEEVKEEGSGRKYIDTAIRNADKLVRTIDQLVTFNKVESGNFQFYLEKGNPLVFIERLGTLFMESARESGISLTIECEDNGEEVWFSPLYTELIVSNLLSNALKFTPEGGNVRISARIMQEKEATYLDINVADNGIGIDPSEHGNIFRKFYQTGRGFNTNHKGWGVGLPLVKKLSELHKGTVTVQSERGSGATFEVMLCVDAEAFPESCRITDEKTVVPLEKYSYTLPLKEMAAPSSEEVAAGRRSRMLIVEDEADLREFLSDLFEDSYAVVTAVNGKEALDRISEAAPDIVISDVMMPEMDGILMCRTIKQELSTSHIPVVLLTAKSDSEDVVKGYMCGAEAYVAKPFDPTILRLQVQNIMKMSRQRLQRVMTDSPEVEIRDDSLNQLDREFISKLNAVIDSNIDNPQLDVMFLTNELGFSRTLLYSKMKSLLGVSIADYIRKKRLALARKMMAQGNNVSETAYAVGFSDPGYFSKVFRKEFGISPTEFIASLQ